MSYANAQPGPDYVVDALDDRPLGLEEDVRHLHEISERMNVDPAAFSIEDDERVIALRLVDRQERVVYLYGYSPSASEWVLVEEWTEEEISPEECREAVDGWIEQFGHELLQEDRR